MLGTLSETCSTGGLPDAPLHPQWHRAAPGTGWSSCDCTNGTTWAEASQWEGYLPLGSSCPAGMVWDLGSCQEWTRHRQRLMQPPAPALEKAVSSASLQLSYFWPFSHPQPVLPHTENVFILPFGFTSGCWGSEGGWYFVFHSSRSSVLIDTCQVWAVKAATFWAECRNVCRGKNRVGWFCFKNKIKVLLKFTHGPRNKHDKL